MPLFPLSNIADQVLQVNSDVKDKLLNVKENNSQALLDLLKGLSNGETILGKVISFTEDSYVFKTLDSDVTVNAKAEKGVSLEPGQTVLFEVNKATDSKVSLRPLNINVNTAETAKMAVVSAGLPLNERTLEMTVRNMEYGNPIDKRSLVEAYKDVMNNPDTPVKYIVDLQKMDVPRTPENLSWYETYNNMENSLFEDFEGLSKELIDMFLPGSEATIEFVKDGADFEDFEALKDMKNFAEALSSDESTAPLAKELKDVISSFEKELISLKEPKDTENKPATPFGRVFMNLEEGASKDTLKDTIKNTGEILDKFSKNVRDVFTRHFNVGLDLSKGEVPVKAKMQDLYERLFSEARKISSSILENVSKESPAFVRATNIASNLDFMNSLNNFVPYIQIPLKNDMGKGVSELYVFKNKHSKSGEDNELTAFLHLDTVNLGPTDIYIKKSYENISTDFKLRDEECLDFIEKNIHYLEKRLTDKGFNFSFKASVNDNPRAPIENAMDNMISKVYIAKTSFDARV